LDTFDLSYVADPSRPHRAPRRRLSPACSVCVDVRRSLSAGKRNARRRRFRWSRSILRRHRARVKTASHTANGHREDHAAGARADARRHGSPRPRL